MSAEEPPPPTSTNGNGAPLKLSLSVGKGLSLAKKKAPLINKSAASAFGNNEDEGDTQKDELIAGLDDNKIESLVPKEEAKPLIIPKLENADWRQQVLAKRKKTYMPEGSLREPMNIVEEPVKEVRYGLQIIKRTKAEHHTELGSDDASTSTFTAITEVKEDIVMEQKEETLDEAAARKIIEATSGERSEDARRLVVHGQENIDDVEAFQKNLEELPDESTLEDYEKVPVEEFGAALLRGMGWNGDMKGSEAIEYNRRPALLGLGAKPKEPEPINKKYIKPGESRTPQAIKVPERHTTGRLGTSNYRDNRDDRGSRDSRGRDSRDSGNRDSRDDRDRDQRREHKDSRSSRDGRDDRSHRNGRDGEGERRRDRSSDRSDRDRSGKNKDGDRYRERDRDRDRDRDHGREKDRDRNRDSRDRRR